MIPNTQNKRSEPPNTITLTISHTAVAQSRAEAVNVKIHGELEVEQIWGWRNLDNSNKTIEKASTQLGLQMEVLVEIR